MRFAWVALILLSVGAMADEPAAAAVQPQMRAVDRDWPYYAELACERVDAEQTHSEVEQRLLERRRQQCLERHKAFFSGGGSR